AEGGLPKGGGVGYEIFDKSDALGTTSFVQNINHLRAMEGELARTIRAIDRIQAARVHLVLPERPLFSRETPEPSASIVVRVRGSLEPQQIRAIRHVVASAVSGLKPQRVSIVDETGRLLVDGAYTKSKKGEMVYQDRSKEQLDRIATLVRSAIGFDQKRGDQVEVVNLRFAEAPSVPPVAEPSGLLGMLQFTKDDVMYVIELGVMMLLGLVVLFMVIRPLVRRILAVEVVPALTEPAPVLIEGNGPNGELGPNQALIAGTSGTAKLIDVAQVQGQV